MTFKKPDEFPLRPGLSAWERARLEALEEQGMTHSDAQAVAAAEDLRDDIARTQRAEKWAAIEKAMRESPIVSIVSNMESKSKS